MEKQQLWRLEKQTGSGQHTNFVHCTANSCSDHILQGWRQHLVLTKPATE